MSNEKVNSGEVVLEAIDTYGVEEIFSSPGSEWSPVWDALAKRRASGNELPHYNNCRHEVLAVSAAWAHAAVTKKLPVILVHTTAGLMNASMAIRMVNRAHIPMVVLAGASITYGEGEIDPGYQWLEHLADPAGPGRVAQTFVKWSGEALSLEALEGTIRHACEIALTPPRGAAFVYTPFELLLQKTNSKPIKKRDIRFESAPKSELVDEAVNLLLNSKSPIIITEHSGRDTKNVATLVELAESLSVPVVEAQVPDYMNFPRDHPLHLGFDATPYLNNSDLVLLIGSGSPWHPPSKWPKEGSKVILIDEDTSRALFPYWNYKVDLTIAGSLDVTLQELLRQVKRNAKQNDSIKQRFEKFQTIHNSMKSELKTSALKLAQARPITTRWICQVLSEVIPNDAIIVDELGSNRRFINQYVNRTEPGTFYLSSIGGLGAGLGYALGVKVAKRDKLVIALMGDGAFNYNPVLPCFGFIQEYGTPIVIVVFDNGGYGAMQGSLLRHFPEGYGVKTGVQYAWKIGPTPNYAGIAREFGGHGEAVEAPEDLRSAIERAISKTKENNQFSLIHIMMARGDARRQRQQE
jgi:acetolactate synthase-1/2/3 large subunit